MANVLIEEKTMTDIANAIRGKSGTVDKMKPAEMPEIIREIASGNPYQILQDKFFYSERLSFSYAFYYSKMTYDDLINLALDTSRGTSFISMFEGCNSLTTVPQLDTSRGTIFNGMFANCNNLTTVPQLDTSRGTSFIYMFANCKSLTTVPQLDTSRGANFIYMFANCNNLTTVPQLDTSRGASFNNMFAGCNNLTTVPQLDTSRGTNFNNMFANCNSLTTVPQLDTSRGTNFNNMFLSCVGLENIAFVANSIKSSILFPDSNKLTVESIRSIIDGLADLTGQTAQTIKFHSDVKNKLTEEQIASVTSKNWSIA